MEFLLFLMWISGDPDVPMGIFSSLSLSGHQCLHPMKVSEGLAGHSGAFHLHIFLLGFSYCTKNYVSKPSLRMHTKVSLKPKQVLHPPKQLAWSQVEKFLSVYVCQSVSLYTNT